MHKRKNFGGLVDRANVQPNPTNFGLIKKKKNKRIRRSDKLLVEVDRLDWICASVPSQQGSGRVVKRPGERVRKKASAQFQQHVGNTKTRGKRKARKEFGCNFGIHWYHPPGTAASVHPRLSGLYKRIGTYSSRLRILLYLLYIQHWSDAADTTINNVMLFVAYFILKKRTKTKGDH